MTLQQHAAARSKSTSRTVSWAPARSAHVGPCAACRAKAATGAFSAGASAAFCKRPSPAPGCACSICPAWARRRGDTSPTRVRPSSKNAGRSWRRRRAWNPVYLVGMSLGAMVATDWIAHHPAEVAGGVLINASVRPFSERFHGAADELCDADAAEPEPFQRPPARGPRAAPDDATG